MIEQLIAEATECDFKVALETKKPKSWLKSVSAFSNGIGGTLFFGVSDDREPIGLSDVQKDAEAISRLIKERITPLPQFILKPLQEDGKNLLALEVSPGRKLNELSSYRKGSREIDCPFSTPIFRQIDGWIGR
jgi:ATP-dependent DNA helicase RecG